jgi:glycosyltransferase involved in cell wall biosynthesis
MAFYKDNPVDVFLNVSESEGCPVSAQEAASCGVPIVATDVGGNSEVATEANGFLLPPNPTPDEIAETLLSLIDHPAAAAVKGENSKALWRTRFAAEQNSQAFADILLAIVSD